MLHVNREYRFSTFTHKLHMHAALKENNHLKEISQTDFMVSGLHLGLFSKDALQPCMSVYLCVHHHSLL